MHGRPTKVTNQKLKRSDMRFYNSHYLPSNYYSRAGIDTKDGTLSIRWGEPDSGASIGKHSCQLKF